MSKTDYLENALLAHQVGKTAYTMPTVHVGLFTGAPSDAGGGTEVSGGSYARKATTGADWSTPSGGSINNANTLTFPTATGSWGTITHFALFDAATAGNMLRWASLTTPKAIASGDVASFPATNLVLTED
jgi:hypothetical protein